MSKVPKYVFTGIMIGVLILSHYCVYKIAKEAVIVNSLSERALNSVYQQGYQHGYQKRAAEDRRWRGK